jgi:tetratricopeptide (TPR) repeat protein
MPHTLPVRRLAARIFCSLALCGAILAGRTPTVAAKEVEGKYPFPVAPRAALERLNRAYPAESPKIHDEEWKVLDAAWEFRTAAAGKEPPAELIVDAMLTASGLQTEAERAIYRDKARKLTAEAREAVKNRKPSTHAGDALLAFLHSGVMKEGYEEHHTSITNVFDTGKYNCVSSAAIYYVVGRELGLNLRIVSIPGTSYSVGHACIDLLDGNKTIEVEPTNPDGFDWETKLKQPGVFIIGPRPDRRMGHLIDGLGLAAVIYSNRGVHVGKNDSNDPNYPAALSLGLRAMFFDPADESVAHNVTAGFVNWGPALAKTGKFAEGLESLVFGYEVTKASDVKNNLCVTAKRWIEERLKAGSDREAQQIIERMLALLPDETDFKRGERWVQYALTCRDEQGPEAALAVVERALAATPQDVHRYLHEHRVNVFRRMSEDLLDKGDYDGSLKVLARAYKLDPQSRDLREGIAWHVRKSLNGLDKDAAAPAAAVAHYRLVATEFPQIKDVAEEAVHHALEGIEALCEAGKYEAALNAAAAYAPLAKSSKEAQKVSARVWELWARRFSDMKQWSESVEKLREGLKACPGDDRLTNGAVATIDSWAKVSIDVGDWNAAIGVYDQGLSWLPENGHLKNNREYCVAKRAEAAKK